MNRPYKAFKEKRIGKRIDYDKSYGYQCVDLIKKYADDILGLGRIWAIGNANKVQYSSTFKGFSKLWVMLMVISFYFGQKVGEAKKDPLIDTTNRDDWEN